MINKKFFLIALMLLPVSQVWAYGSSSGSNATDCLKPTFSEFKPAPNAKIEPGAAFSFFASPNTYAESIQVTVKGRPVEVTQTVQNKGLLISGQLPAELSKEFARIVINAESVNRCKADAGWLVEIQ